MAYSTVLRQMIRRTPSPFFDKTGTSFFEMLTRSVAKRRQREHDVIEMVRFVTREHGDFGAALNGSGHNIYDFEFYKNKTPSAFHSEIKALSRTHDDAFANDGTVRITGIGSGGFHSWVAKKIRTIDPEFTFALKLGKGFQAQEIQHKANKWLDRQPETTPVHFEALFLN